MKPSEAEPTHAIEDNKEPPSPSPSSNLLATPNMGKHHKKPRDSFVVMRRRHHKLVIPQSDKKSF